MCSSLASERTNVKNERTTGERLRQEEEAEEEENDEVEEKDKTNENVGRSAGRRTAGLGPA